MFIDFMLKVFAANREKDSIIWKDRTFTYEWLLERVRYWQDYLQAKETPVGSVCVIEADFSPNSVALLLALIDRACIVVPLTASVSEKKDKFLDLAQAEFIFSVDSNDEINMQKIQRKAAHEFYTALREKGHPGLILFSSGSTGASKAALHDFVELLEKFQVRRHAVRMMTFLLYDHIGGVNTMLYALSNAGCIVTVQDRSPDATLKATQDYGVQLLPTSPTFINLILLSEAYKRYDLSKLETMTYGTEPMLESALERIHAALPHVRLLQTYGLSELGILRSKSKDSTSLWVKIGGEGFQTKVVDGVLWIKAKSAMLGYLNAPSPFDAEGWMNTQDMVEVDGEYCRILGRKSEIINVGGEKVYPAEVESVLMQLENIKDVSVYGEKNPITGNIVAARVNLFQPKEITDLKREVRAYCRGKLAPFKVPVKISVTNEEQYNDRFKKRRIVV